MRKASVGVTTIAGLFADITMMNRAGGIDRMSKFDARTEKPIVLAAWRAQTTPLVLGDCGTDRMKGTS
jgi:hypothetical protein